MRMLTELGKRIDELKNVKQNQSELKKIITKRKIRYTELAAD